LKKIDFIIPCAELLDHQNPYCQNKYLGAACFISLSVAERKFLKKKKSRIKILCGNKQSMVAYPAKEVLKRLKQ